MKWVLPEHWTVPTEDHRFVSDREAEVRWMSVPEVARAVGLTWHGSAESMLNFAMEDWGFGDGRHSDYLKVTKIRSRLVNGQPIDPISIVRADGRVTDYGGLHRLVAAWMEGIARVPVVVVEG